MNFTFFSLIKVVFTCLRLIELIILKISPFLKLFHSGLSVVCCRNKGSSENYSLCDKRAFWEPLKTNNLDDVEKNSQYWYPIGKRLIEGLSDKKIT